MNDHRCVVGGGKFLPPGSPYIEELRKKFRCPNPAYNQAMALRQNGKYIQVPDENVYACQMIPIRHLWGTGLMVPRGIELGSQYPDMEFTSKISYPGLTNPDHSQLYIRSCLGLRPYQQEAVDAIGKHGEGLIIAPCGAGKTFIGLASMTRFNTKTIVLVHTHDLAEQWKDRLEMQLVTHEGDKPHVTLYGGGKRDDSGQIVIAMFQSLIKERWEDLHEWGKQFGMCIVDEAHHVPATTFSQVMMSMPAKIRIGLTATPDRADGLSDILYWHFGKALYRITTQKLIEEGRVLAPEVHFTRTRWSPPGKMDWAKLITRMCDDEIRNDQILEMVERLIGEGRQVLILSDRVQHCIDMAERVANRGMSAAALVGKMTKKQRAEVIGAADRREVKAIFATTVADEGLDLPGLDTVVLTTPTKAMGRIQQRIGRIMRTANNKKTPMVIDLVDNSKPSYYAHKKRAKFYRELGCNVQDL